MCFAFRPYHTTLYRTTRNALLRGHATAIFGVCISNLSPSIHNCVFADNCRISRNRPCSVRFVMLYNRWLCIVSRLLYTGKHEPDVIAERRRCAEAYLLYALENEILSYCAPLVQFLEVRFVLSLSESTIVLWYRHSNSNPTRRCTQANSCQRSCPSVCVCSTIHSSRV